MSKTNIKCPHCHSNKLYKFALDKQTNQKCQFSPNDGSSPRCSGNYIININLHSLQKCNPVIS